MVAAQLAQASSARPGEPGCFLQKQQPSGGIFWRAQVGLVAICTPIFTKFTPSAVFWWFFFRKVTETYEFRNDTCFLSVMLRVATYPSAGGRRETRGMRVPWKEYAQSRHQRLFEENVGKTGKDAIYEL